MSEPKKPLIDPKELFPAAAGFVVGLCILGFFIALALGLGLTTLVDHHNIPHQ